MIYDIELTLFGGFPLIFTVERYGDGEFKVHNIRSGSKFCPVLGFITSKMSRADWDKVYEKAEEEYWGAREAAICDRFEFRRAS